jgi:hypothetical protein
LIIPEGCLQALPGHHRNRAKASTSTVPNFAVVFNKATDHGSFITDTNVRDGVLFRSPRDEAERVSVAGKCVRKMGIKFPAVVDSFDNQVEIAYAGWTACISSPRMIGFSIRASPAHSDFIFTI